MKQSVILSISTLLLLTIAALVYYLNGHMPTKQGQNFSIPSTQGEYQLKNDRGKVVILYFGYRFCPDICPTTLSELASIRKKLSTEEKEKFQVVFISLDPKRDTISELSEYVKFFHPTFIGATSTRNKLDILANFYGVRYKINKPLDAEQTFYTVDHSASAFIIGKDGVQRDIFLYGEKDSENFDKIKKYIGEKI